MDNCLDPRRIYAQLPSALATPPQSPPTDEGWPPNQAAAMPLVTDLLARNGHLNVPPGLVLCIPCYLCNQPFNNIETFKEHLTQHATEIHAWQAAREPPMQPMFQPFPQPMGQPMGHPAGSHPAGPYILPMEYPQQPMAPMVSIPGPSQPQMAFPMPPMPFPMQRQHPLMAVQPPLEYPGHCPCHQPPQMEFPCHQPPQMEFPGHQPPQMECPVHQGVHRSLPQTPQSPLEVMDNQFGFRKIRPMPPPYQPPMEPQRNPHFMMQQAPPPVELQRIFLQKPIEARNQHLPKEQPPQLQEKNLKDQLPIEARLRMPPSMELQRIVLQKPQQPIEANNQNFPAQSPEKILEHRSSLHTVPPSVELQRIVLQKPQQPLQSPIETKEHIFPVEQPQPQSPDKQQFSPQKRLSISPPKELQPRLQTPNELLSPPNELLSPPSMRGRFQCEWCGKKLSSRQSVRYHQSRFHFRDDPPTEKIGKNVQKHFRCDTCKKRYKRRTFLLMHMKIKHGIHGSEAVAEEIDPATVDSPVEDLPSPERLTSPMVSEEPRREVWSTKVFNSVAAASYNPATEQASKYVNAPRQQFEQPEELESEFAAKPKRVYPMRSPFFNPDLWLDCDWTEGI